MRDDSSYLTAGQVQEIQAIADIKTVKEMSTRDKLIWFSHKIDENTVDFTQGYNEITIDRENIIQDSMKYFLDIKDLKKVQLIICLPFRK